MLFEREPLTEQGKIQVLNRIFNRVSRRKGASPPAPGHMPPAVLMAYGDCANHINYIIESLKNADLSRSQKLKLRQVEKLAATLPNAMATSMTASPWENWLCLCRHLLRAMEGMEHLGWKIDQDEYETLTSKIIQLVSTVSQASVVEVNAASMFTLLLMQKVLQRRRRRTPKRRRKRSTTKRGAASATIRPRTSSLRQE